MRWPVFLRLLPPPPIPCGSLPSRGGYRLSNLPRAVFVLLGICGRKVGVSHRWVDGTGTGDTSFCRWGLCSPVPVPPIRSPPPAIPCAGAGMAPSSPSLPLYWVCPPLVCWQNSVLSYFRTSKDVPHKPKGSVYVYGAQVRWAAMCRPLQGCTWCVCVCGVCAGSFVLRVHPVVGIRRWCKSARLQQQPSPPPLSPPLPPRFHPPKQCQRVHTRGLLTALSLSSLSVVLCCVVLDAHGADGGGLPVAV